MTTTTNYKDVYSWSTPTKIVGQPTLETIDDLENTLKKNATKTHSTLSDGVHGHLGLVLSPQAYALISDAPYVQPQLPAPLVIPAQTTQVQAANLKDIHSRATSLFFEVHQVKAQLLSQIEESVEEDFLRGMIHPDTAQLQVEIWEILDTLSSKMLVCKPESSTLHLRVTKQVKYLRLSPTTITLDKILGNSDLIWLSMREE